ncbi:2'-5' RNA ligase family protein [Limnoraphis robusta]|uniref:2'-5' RNA ligase family protein n=1 Tax=Limnoraphis robusta TaxID=1118279 RepID=UPI002B1F63A5|nr:2'-5' RNA ligase family protein [Limnoraphis robusta]MEA5497663.1 2'-5' RNA ligase family protein [Limnoraphis robusta BA-68 BA1]
MKSSEPLLFIALLPPMEVQNEVTQIKQYFAQNYNSSHALKSPPHVTLQPPFKWLTEDFYLLEECLTEFAKIYAPIPITLSGFGSFPPRVIYVNVIKTPELMEIKKHLMSHLETTLTLVDEVSKSRPFSPHMTVAFKDLTRQNFKLGWQEFEHKPLKFEFTVSQLTLLIHNGEKWNIQAEFPFLLSDKIGD